MKGLWLFCLLLPAMGSAETCFNHDTRELKLPAASKIWPLGLKEELSRTPAQDFQAFLDRKPRYGYEEEAYQSEPEHKEDLLEGVKTGTLELVRWSRTTARICEPCGLAILFRTQGIYLRSASKKTVVATLEFSGGAISVDAEGTEKEHPRSLGYCPAKLPLGRLVERPDDYGLNRDGEWVQAREYMPYGFIALSDSGKYVAVGHVQGGVGNRFTRARVVVSDLDQKNRIVYGRSLDGELLEGADGFELLNFGSVLKVHKKDGDLLLNLEDPNISFGEAHYDSGSSGGRALRTSRVKKAHKK